LVYRSLDYDSGLIYLIGIVNFSYCYDLAFVLKNPIDHKAKILGKGMKLILIEL